MIRSYGAKIRYVLNWILEPCPRTSRPILYGLNWRFSQDMKVSGVMLHLNRYIGLREDSQYSCQF